jgi:UPF0716 family protein affecting phage T7 exclusion
MSITRLLKVAGGGIIVVAAFLIMMPGLITYFAYLGRITIYIAIIVLGAVIMTVIYATINRRKKIQSGSEAVQDEGTSLAGVEKDQV